MAQSRMRRAVCFDTTPIIWGVREDADPNDQHMIEHTKRYIKYLSENRYSIMIPSPVVAEYFVGATETQFHEKEILIRGFELPDFDVRCAELAARLQRGGMVDELHREFGLPKQSIRIDSFIIAVAIINNAEKIITNNEREFTKLARGKIEVDNVPILQEQQTMEFGEGSEERD